ncbi:CIC11C00000004269 [Sungouiella intermedia]|uniref:CIC11C00000004269 n=1 Tax=Sungouiella intermedia TaxID=45354 RepID=A0A1L0CZK7_9ASCO|nr:CIC11C00000004269 [[Candida] intermedia]
MSLLDKFILFGDSITQYASDQSGFALAPALQHLYQRKLDIITRGFSGYNTNSGLIVLRELLKADLASSGSIKLMYIFMGTNDAATTFQHVPLAQYKENLDKMAKMVLDKGIKLIIVGPGLHDQALSTIARGDGDVTPPFSSSKETRIYADTAASVAHENSVPFIDLWTLFQNYGKWTTEELLEGSPDLHELLVDGIHFSPKAYELLYEELVATISATYPELLPDNLPSVFPNYDELDYDNLEKSIMDSIKK